MEIVVFISLSNEILEKIFLYTAETNGVCKDWDEICSGETFVMQKVHLFQKELGIGSFLDDKINSKILKNRLLRNCGRDSSPDLPPYSVIHFLCKAIKIKNLKLVQGRAPLPTFATLKKLDLSKTHLTSLPEELKGLTSIENLNISDGKFTKVSGKLLNCWKNMRTFWMMNTSVTKLPKSFGKEWKELEILYLSGNCLSTLPSTFSERFPELLDLSLSSNELEDLPEDLGVQWNKLKQLAIASNKLTRFPSSLWMRKEQLTLFSYDTNKIRYQNAYQLNSAG